MQQREFPSLLFFPNGEREFPSPSVFSLCRKGIPLLFLLMMTLLFSPLEQRDFFFFLVSPFPIRGLRIPLSSHHLTPRGEEGFLCLLFSVLTAPVFCFNISVWELLLFFSTFFFFLIFLSTAFYPTNIRNQTPTSSLVTGSCDLNITVST